MSWKWCIWLLKSGNQLFVTCIVALTIQNSCHNGMSVTERSIISISRSRILFARSPWKVCPPLDGVIVCRDLFHWRYAAPCAHPSGKGPHHDEASTGRHRGPVCPSVRCFVIHLAMLGTKPGQRSPANGACTHNGSLGWGKLGGDENVHCSTNVCKVRSRQITCYA